METDNIGAITGIANRVGDHRKPERNCAPNPGNYWWTAVLFPSGWHHFQKQGEEAINKKLKSAIATAKRLHEEERKARHAGK
jgi:hypothetical protein